MNFETKKVNNEFNKWYKIKLKVWKIYFKVVFVNHDSESLSSQYGRTYNLRFKGGVQNY